MQGRNKIPFEDTGAELRPPPFHKAVCPDTSLWVVLYFIAFQLLALFVKRNFWQQASGFRRYRLHNLTVCFVHSMISGAWSLGFLLTNPHLMFQHILHWYEPSARHLIFFSTGYFFHDALDLLRNEWSRWTVELIFHHTACIFVFACAILPHKFLLYAYWALLMEVNSIFLHIRTISQLNGIPKSNPSFYKFVQCLNFVTFIVFRFGVQTFQISWIWLNRSNIHYFYFCVGFFGGAFFFILNVCLFIRLLTADKIVRSKATGPFSVYSISRDDQVLATRTKSVMSKSDSSAVISSNNSQKKSA